MEHRKDCNWKEIVHKLFLHSLFKLQYLDVSTLHSQNMFLIHFKAINFLLYSFSSNEFSNTIFRVLMLL